MSYSRREAIENRRRNWRIILGTIIVITIPFYCVGVFLWGTAPQHGTPTPSEPTRQQVEPTSGPIIVTATVEGVASITPLPITLFPTQEPFPSFTVPTTFPTAIIATRFLSPTPTFIPLPTNPPPPTQAPQPTNPPPPTQPPITDTPLPFDTPLPP